MPAPRRASRRGWRGGELVAPPSRRPALSRLEGGATGGLARKENTREDSCVGRHQGKQDFWVADLRSSQRKIGRP
jgi:hypothetical protein